METPERCCSCVFIINFEHVFVYLVVSSPAVKCMPKVNKTIWSFSSLFIFNFEQIKPNSLEFFLLAVFALLVGTTTLVFLGIILAISSAFFH